MSIEEPGIQMKDVNTNMDSNMNTTAALPRLPKPHGALVRTRRLSSTTSLLNCQSPTCFGRSVSRRVVVHWLVMAPAFFRNVIQVPGS